MSGLTRFGDPSGAGERCCDEKARKGALVLVSFASE